VSSTLWLGSIVSHSLTLSVYSTFSARLEGGSDRIIPRRRHIVTVSFMPRQEGRYEAVLELKFHNHKHKMNFVIRRTLSGRAKRPANELGRQQNGFARAPLS
jgi:hypothetical protein